MRCGCLRLFGLHWKHGRISFTRFCLNITLRSSKRTQPSVIADHSWLLLNSLVLKCTGDKICIKKRESAWKLFSKECELTISWHMFHFVIHDFLKKIAINRTKVAIRAKSLCDNPIYSFKRYAINRCFYLTLDRIWFGISDLYSIKRYMRLSGMQLTDFVCI